MRLRQFRPGSVDVRRGGSRGSRVPGGRAGGIGLGGLLIVLVGVFVFGADPAQILGMVDGAQQQQSGSVTDAAAPGRSHETAMEICDDNQYAMEGCNALGSLNETWEPVFRQARATFERPTLWYYEGGTRSGCGAASASMGPFYCPADEGIYIDTGFYDLLSQQMGAGGDFARYYVMAHEYGHHVQHLTGVAQQVRELQAANPDAANGLQVRMELQADCYAGVWAGRNRELVEPGDMEEGLRAAGTIGDDTLMRQAGRAVNPDSFTHGSSRQRMDWLQRGMESGDDDTCDTFTDFAL